MGKEQKAKNEVNIKSIPLQNLYLDPNNYRFIDNENYVKVSEELITDDKIQLRTRNFILGKTRDNVKDLIDSFKKNGYLPVDQIQVKRIDENKYVVVEGNRRVTALYQLWEDNKNGNNIGNLDESIFDEVPIVFYADADEKHHHILMALKHISGNKKWSPVNQAMLINDMVEKYNMKEDEIAQSIGIKKLQLIKALRALAFIDDYKKSEYGDQFKPNMYSVFEETLTKPKLRDWLKWDDNNKEANDFTNKNRFFSWISEDEEYIDEDNEDSGFKKIDKIITKSSEIRELAKFIDDEKALSAMESTRMFSDAHILSDAIGKDKLDNSLNSIISNIDTAFQFSSHSTSNTRKKLVDIQNKLNGLMTAKGYSEIVTNKSIEREIVFSTVGKHFSHIQIQEYKRISNLELDNLNQINIFAGVNNSGKSSLLEAIYLLGKGSDIYALFDIYRRRGKFSKELDLLWFYENFTSDVKINAIFNNTEVDLTINKNAETDATIDKNKYLTSIFNNFNYDNIKRTSKSRVYKDNNETYFDRLYTICNTSLSSPFSTQNKEDIIKYHQKSLETKSYQLIIEFIKEQLDNNIVDIELEGELKRFIVNHNSFNEGIDITSFGEGMQRVFYIALQFASAKDGVLLIDEFENGIHYTLLQDFSIFIQQLAIKFNVQVFITSHSEECIKAFVSNNYNNQDISFFTLVKDKDNQVKTINYDYKTLIEELEQDSEIRGW